MIYLDNSATTGVCRQAVEKMDCVLKETWGNPSSLYSKGLEAERIVQNAKKDILKSLCVRDTESISAMKRLIFTGSGTEADNLAIFGTAFSKKSHSGGRIITSDSEHPAVLECCRVLAERGYDVVYIPTEHGIFDMERFHEALNERTFLVSVMTVNNETGAMYNIKEIFGEAKRRIPGVITHTDAVQAYTHVPFYPDRICADMVTISAHKIHGPKGVGALMVREELLKAKKIVPFIHGGGQEFGMRSGTENVPGIAGFGAAAELYCEGDIARKNFLFKSLREYLLKKLPECVRVNQPLGEYAPHIINLTLPDIKSETMLHFLSEKEIFVSSGSACSSHGKGKNRVLSAFGLTVREADCAIRISLGDDTTEEDLDVLADTLADGCRRLARIK